MNNIQQGEIVATNTISDRARFIAKPQIDNYLPELYNMLGNREEVRKLRTCVRSWFARYMSNGEYNNPVEMSEDALSEIVYTYQQIDEMFDKLIVSGDCSDSWAAIADAMFNMSNELISEKNLVRDWHLSCLSDFKNRHDSMSQAFHVLTFEVLDELFSAFIYQHQDIGKTNSSGLLVHKLAA